MTIKDDLNAALDAERQEGGTGVRSGDLLLRMGPGAVAALLATGGAERDVHGMPIRYREVPIERVPAPLRAADGRDVERGLAFYGWELRA